VLGAAAAKGQLVYSPHMPFPGIGKIGGSEGAFRWVPK
jgi:hypothetical protein